MKISKPNCLSLMVRPYRWRGESRIGLSIIALVDASNPAPILESETAIWDLAKTSLDCGGAIEYGIPKVSPEFLVSGNAYSKFTKNKRKVDITVTVHDKIRQLRVFGDRKFINKQITEPSEFETISMNWSNSYGGEKFDNNPSGKGFIGVNNIDFLNSIDLPNIEDPRHLIVDPRDEHKAYNLGPQSIVWPVRFSKVGNYSEEWKKRDFPGFFPDMDPTIFNSAQEGQIFEELDFFPNNTKFSVVNMHPDKEIWKGITPAWHGKCIVVLQKTPEDEEVLVESSLKLKTLWLVPEIEKYLLIFQDSIPGWFEDGSEINHVLAALEWTYSPKDIYHYKKFIQLRNDHYTSALTAYSDEDLLPENVQFKGIVPKAEDIGDLSEKMIKYQEYIQKISREHLKEMGLNPHHYIPQSMGPHPRSNLRFLPEKQIWLDEKVAEMREHFKEIKEAKKKFLLSKGKNNDFDSLTRGDEFFESLKTDSEKIDLEKNLNDTKLSKLNRMYQDSYKEDDPRLVKLEKRMVTMSAQFDQSKYLHRDNQTIHNKESLNEIIKKGNSVEGLNLLNANLCNTKYKDLDFSLTNFSRTNLSNAQFTNCIFNEGALSHAELNNTHFENCSFISTNFNESKIKNSKFFNCNFEKNIVFNHSIEGSEFIDCNFKDCMYQNIQILNSVFKGSGFDGFLLLQGNIKKSDFTESEWVRCAFSEIEIKSSLFNNAYFLRMAFTNVKLIGIDFKSSWIEAMAIVSDDSLKDIDFTNSYIKNSNFRNLNFLSCKFDSSIIENTELSKSTFIDLSARSIEIPDAIFRRSRFKRCDFSESNFMSGTFTYSEFSEVNFTHVNFFRCEMGQTVIKDDCIEHENYMVQIQLEPSERGVQDAN